MCTSEGAGWEGRVRRGKKGKSRRNNNTHKSGHGVQHGLRRTACSRSGESHRLKLRPSPGRVICVKARRTSAFETSTRRLLDEFYTPCDQELAESGRKSKRGSVLVSQVLAAQCHHINTLYAPGEAWVVQCWRLQKEPLWMWI